MFWVTTLVRTAGAVFDVLIVARLNVVVGIPDKLAYLLGSTIIYNVVYMMDFMPAVVLTTRLCPKDLEAVIYALLAGYQNFGQQVSRTIGVVLISSRKYGVRTDMDGGECDFDNLPRLIAVCHMLLPLITVPLTFVLIPRARLDERLLADPETSLARFGKVMPIDYKRVLQARARAELEGRDPIAAVMEATHG